MSLIAPEKQVYTALDVKDAFFVKGESIHLCFEWTDPEEDTKGNLSGPGCSKDLKFFQLSLMTH